MPSNNHNETVLIERIARLEEAVRNNERLILGMAEKLDNLINELHSDRFDVLSQYGNLNVRVSKLEQRLESESKTDYMWYTKIGLFVAVVSAIIDYMFKLIGR